MSRNYSITEPHPTVPKKGAYIGGGRGGAGNYRHYDSTQVTTGPNAIGPASRITLSKPQRRTIPAGRGGAGNMYSESDESIFQFDEEMLTRRERQAPVYHIGRGGAANYVDDSKPRTTRQGSTASTSSQASDESTAGIRRSTERAINSIFRRSS